MAMLFGRVWSDPTIRKTAFNATVCNFELVTSVLQRDRYEVSYHSIAAFGNLAEILKAKARLGDQIYVSGRIVYRKWTDQKGNPQTKVEVIADLVKFDGGVG